MPKVNCAVTNCSISTHKRKKWKQEICYEDVLEDEKLLR